MKPTVIVRVLVVVRTPTPLPISEEGFFLLEKAWRQPWTKCGKRDRATTSTDPTQKKEEGCQPKPGGCRRCRPNVLK